MKNQRQCMGCNTRKDKNDMIRVLRLPAGEVIIDYSGNQNGRGAYICVNSECLKRIRKSKRIERSLKTSINPEIYEIISEKCMLRETDKPLADRK